MRALALLTALLTFGAACADKIVVQYVRPSKLLRQITGDGFGKGTQGLIPIGITSFSADDLAGAIVAEGPPEAIQELTTIVQAFDVPPRKVSVKITIKSPADKYVSTTATEITNNSSWTLDDGTTGVDLRVSPRINGDGTVTGHLGFGSGPDLDNSVTRFQNKVPMEFRLQGGPNSTRQPAKTKEEARATDILVTVTFTILDFPGEGPIKP